MRFVETVVGWVERCFLFIYFHCDLWYSASGCYYWCVSGLIVLIFRLWSADMDSRERPEVMMCGNGWWVIICFLFAYFNCNLCHSASVYCCLCISCLIVLISERLLSEIWFILRCVLYVAQHMAQAHVVSGTTILCIWHMYILFTLMFITHVYVCLNIYCSLLLYPFFNTKLINLKLTSPGQTGSEQYSHE